MRLAARLGTRRTGPGPDPLPRPLEIPDLDFLLFFMISSRLISKGAAMFKEKFNRNTEGAVERGSKREREEKIRVSQFRRE